MQNDGLNLCCDEARGDVRGTRQNGAGQPGNVVNEVRIIVAQVDDIIGSNRDDGIKPLAIHDGIGALPVQQHVISPRLLRRARRKRFSS